MALSLRSVPACLASLLLRLHLAFLFCRSEAFPRSKKKVDCFRSALQPSAFSLLSAQPAVRLAKRDKGEVEDEDEQHAGPRANPLDRPTDCLADDRSPVLNADSRGKDGRDARQVQQYRTGTCSAVRRVQCSGSVASVC
ncbi:hypothetical protein IWZ03DRAFT_359697 [Phyllosticta citriasiana]|uniref:Secreted protein n=1 Tax=Phyllosticta citriasiana TaxID=595635 RepID=A0ABR1KNT7_9PEZI